MRTGPQLVTYADRLAGDLAGVRRLLDGPLAGAFTGVHVLPFYVPIDGADAGFDPVDHGAVDPRVGSWDDVAELAEHHDVMADLIVNHVSDRSLPFLDWVARGDASPHAGMFLTMSSVFPHGATERDLALIYRPRPGVPFTPVRLADGTVRLVWTTFTPQQIDLDVDHPATWAYLVGLLDRLEASGVGLVRLDAVGYAVKRAGTSCFMLPETLALVDRLTAEGRRRGITVLVEVRGHHSAQIEIARHTDLVYDFALPALLLDALDHGDGRPLRTWLAVRPANSVNPLDTHDGIGITDVGPDADRPGLLPDDRLGALVDGIVHRSGGTADLARAGSSRLGVYQVNCTYHDALGGDERRHLLARLVQVLVPGIPQIYYVGLLGGCNDVELRALTGTGRDVNRHRYTPDELATALERPFTRSLLALLRWRSCASVFDGTFEVPDAADHELALRWAHGDDSLDVRIDLAAATFVLHERRDGRQRVVTDVAAI